MTNWIVILQFLLCVSLFGCANFHEVHYFKSLDSEHKPLNYFRLTVQGNAGLSSARYVASCFDERAVDLFFNELKAPEHTFRPILNSGKTNDPQVPVTSTELDSCKEPGKFVMIMSTNADSVANTIGAFAESNITAEALTNLLNRDSVIEAKRLNATADAMTHQLSAVSSELEELLNIIPTVDPSSGKSPPTKSDAENGLLRVLNAIGRVLGAPPFTDFPDAEKWISRNRTAAIGGQ